MTPPEYDALFRTLNELRRLAYKLTRMPVPIGDEVADVLGQTRAIEVLLADWRRALTAEQDEPAVGLEYETVVTRKATRSYSTSPILVAVTAEDPKGGVVGALMRLREAGALKFTWSWSKLQRYFAQADIDLTIANHEIADDGDLDGPMVGQVWTETTRIVPKKASE